MVHIYIADEEGVNQIMLECSNNTNTDSDLEITFWNDFNNSIHFRMIADMIILNRTIQALKLNICPRSWNMRYRPTSEQEQLIADALLVNKTIVKFDMDFFNYPLILDALKQRTVYQNDLYNSFYQVIEQRKIEEAALRALNANVDMDDDVDDDVNGTYPHLETDQPHVTTVMLMLVLTSLPTVDCTEHLEYLTQKYELQRQKALVRLEYHSLIHQEIQLRGSYMRRTHGSNGRISEWIEPFDDHRGVYPARFDQDLTPEELELSQQRRQRIHILWGDYIDAQRA